MDMSFLVDGKLSMRYWNDPVLSTVCDPVEEDEFGVGLVRLGELMLDFIKDRGIGLAAPQIGLSKRIFVMTRQDEGLPVIIAVNPTIETSGQLVPHQEGCLSIPGIYEQVARPFHTVLKYQDPLTGEQESVELSDYDAYCAQHELDHLDGIMFFDRRRMAKNPSKQVERKWDKVKHQYAVR